MNATPPRTLAAALAARSGLAGDADDDGRLADLQEMFANKHLLDWRRADELARGLVTDHGADLRVLAFGALASFRVRGWSGLADGLAAWQTALTDRWEDVGPARAALRVGPSRRLVDTLHRWLVTAVDQAGPNGDDDLPEVGPDAAAVHAACAHGDAVVVALTDRFGTNVPVDRRWLDRLAAIAAEHAPVAPPTTPAAPEPPPVTTAARPDPTPRAPAGPIPVAAPPVPDVPTTPDAARLKDGFGKLRAAALPWSDALQGAAPARPEAWRLPRDLAYAAFAPPAGARVPTPALPDVAALTRAPDPATRLDTAERAWRRHLLWLDPHRVVADSLRALGHHDAADAVTDTVRSWARRWPGLLDLHYAADTVVQRPDGTVGPPAPVPCADAATRAWLTAPAAPSRTPDSGSPEPHAQTDATSVLDLTPMTDALARNALAEAMAAWGRAARAVSPRDRIRLTVTATQALLDAGHGRLAIPALTSSDEDIQRFEIEVWEPDLASALLGKVLTVARVHPDALDERTVQTLQRRLARLGHLDHLAV
ncbi:MAG: type VI secretion system domain-containing protein [Alphaproteobacteria bacterium]|nr:type VI secretion system domain-containing protein [Alphaproteobacteria bacterium]